MTPAERLLEWAEQVVNANADERAALRAGAAALARVDQLEAALRAVLELSAWKLDNDIWESDEQVQDVFTRAQAALTGDPALRVLAAEPPGDLVALDRDDLLATFCDLKFHAERADHAVLTWRVLQMADQWIRRLNPAWDKAHPVAVPGPAAAPTEE